MSCYNSNKPLRPANTGCRPTVIQAPSNCTPLQSGAISYNGLVIPCLNLTSIDNLNTVIKKMADEICALRIELNALKENPATCANISNVTATKTGANSASVSFVTNKPTDTFAYSVDGSAYTNVTTNPFTINGLSAAVHTITVGARNTSGAICASDNTTVDLTVVVNTLTAYYTASDSNTPPDANEILGWTSTQFTAGGTVTANFAQFNSAPKILMYAEPVTEPAKTVYYFSDDDKGDIGPDGPWAQGIVIGSFRVYITNYATQTDVLPLQFRIS